MEKKKIILLDKGSKPGFCKKCAKHLTEFLNTEVTFIEVLNELFLYERGLNPNNEVLSKYVVNYLEDATINNEYNKPTNKPLTSEG